MTTEVTFTAPSQAEIDRHIARAHQMRGDAMAALVKAGFARLKAFFAPKTGAAGASA